MTYFKMTSVNFKTASLILDRAFMEATPINDELAKLISSILHGSHKTYRYILITAMLAKATNEKVNALSLQKGDGKNGKYDARSLCHKVVVPFETIKLPGCLGGSNEPFLNKPARFVALSLNNATRRGKDRQTLSDVITVVNSLKDSQTAFSYLKSAMCDLKEISEQYVSKFSIGDSIIDISEFSQIVLDYIYSITDQSLEGEVCPLIVSQLEKMYLGKDYKVEPHKVNQSGASSKEVGDIDIYNKANKLIYSIEVKDKDFTEQDVIHAITKFIEADLSTSMFIYGKNAPFDEDAVFKALKAIGREGHYCCLISILHYAKLRICDLKTLTIREFVDGLLKFAKVINAKDDTINTIKDIASKIF